VLGVIVKGIAASQRWVLFVWHESALRGPLPGPGAFPAPGDRLPVRVAGLDYPIQVRVIRTRETARPPEAVAVTSAVPSSARPPRRPNVPPALATTGAAAPDESITLADLVDHFRAQASKPPPPFLASTPLAASKPQQPMPETVGRDEPDVGAVLGSVLGIRVADSHRLRSALVPSLRHPLRTEIRRLTEAARTNGRPDRGRGYLADRFRWMLRYLNALERVVGAAESSPDSVPRLARWLVQENVLLREEIRGWLRLEPRLCQTR
jgi:hypothetical protein